MVKKKYSLLETILYYDVLWLILLGLIFFFLKDYLFYFIVRSTGLNPRDNRNVYDTVSLTVNMALPIIWFYICFFVLRSKRYYRLTGRSFFSDSRQYAPYLYSDLVEYFKDAEPHRLDTEIFPRMRWQDSKSIVFGRDHGRLIQIPSSSECNIAVYGPPGSGKTRFIAIVNAITFNGSLLAVDIKGDIYKAASKFRKILRFCPDDPDALNVSLHFNPLKNINNMNYTDRKLYIQSMGTILIADDPKDKYFIPRARKFFQGIVHLMLYENPSVTFPDIIHTILNETCYNWVTKAIESDCLEAVEYLSSFYGNNEKNISGAYECLCNVLVNFSNPVLDELLTDSKRSLSMNLLERGYDIYLQIDQDHLDQYAPLFTLILQSLSTEFTKRPDSSTGIKNRPIMMLLDEFPALTYSYALINSNLSTLRSKSIICMIIQQNLAQLEYRYGKEGARAIIGNCNYQVILGSNDPQSSRTFSEMFGTKKILKVTMSQTSAEAKTYTRSIQQEREPVFYPEEFGDLGDNMILYFKGKYCKCKKVKQYNL